MIDTKRWSCAALCLLFVSGCSNRPSALSAPDVDAEADSAAAIAKYDTNGDGMLADEEIAAAPSINFLFQRKPDRIDTNGDAKVSKEEIATYIDEQIAGKGSGIVGVRAEVTLDGRPLDGAMITLEPEEFMAHALHPAQGELFGGRCTIKHAAEHLPHPNAKGTAPGLYLVRITKIVNDKETIPAKYNVDTTLGVEVASRALYLPGPVVFNLTSN